MSGGIRTHCRKCYTKLKSHVCPKCGWSYEKEFSGQRSLGLEDSDGKK